MHGYRAERKPLLPDELIAELAAEQENVVWRSQLVDAGPTRAMIETRLRRGSLHRRHQGVYAVGSPRLSERGGLLADARRCGEAGTVGRRSAAHLWRLVGRPLSRETEIISPTQRRSGGGVRCLRMPLRRDEVTKVGVVPVTTVERTLVDLAAVARAPVVEIAVREALVRRLTSPRDLWDAVEAAAGRTGSGLLRAALADYLPGDELRSEAEADFLAGLRARGVPRPRTNRLVQLGTEMVRFDFFWPAGGLAVELDSWTFHGDRRMFSSDRRRDRVARAEGIEVLRVSLDELRGSRREATLDEVAAAVERATSPSALTDVRSAGMSSRT